MARGDGWGVDVGGGDGLVGVGWKGKGRVGGVVHRYFGRGGDDVCASVGL